MFKNHIKIAWRALKANKMFSFLNICGLSVGLTIATLLYLFIIHERSYDTYHHRQEYIYRVLVNADDSYDSEVLCTAPAAVAPAIRKELNSVSKAARMWKHNFGDTAFLRVDGENFLEKELYWCDPELFQIFDIPFVRGNPASAIKRPNTVVLSQSASNKYFGNTDPIGKTIVVDNDQTLEVTGVYQDFPGNSTLHCNMIASFSTTFAADRPTWNNASFETYVLLHPKVAIKSVESRLQTLLDKNVDKQSQWYQLSLQPLNRVHLYSADYTNSYTNRIGDIDEIRNLSFLALLIVFIACVNYMNLMTARSEKRAKDVGINKTLGATSSNLIIRFYAETGLITLIALGIGLLLTILAIPIFNSVTGQQLDIAQLVGTELIVGLALVWTFTTLIAGSYPAFYLSNASAKIIGNTLQKKSGRVVNIRKGLVILQFAASVILIVAVLIIYQQLEYLQNKKLGYEPEKVLAISTAGINATTVKDALLQELKAISSVSNVAMAQGFPGISVSGRTLLKNDNDENGLQISTNRSDSNVIDLLKLKLLAGTSLPANKSTTDTLIDVVLNKKALSYLGLTPKEAIGKKALIGGFRGNASIIGVVDDFNFESLHRPIGAYAFHNARTEAKSFALVRFHRNTVSNVMSDIQSVFKKVAPESALDYVFLDANLAQLYGTERRTALTSALFSVLAVFIACLGLFGLAAFTTEQRKKEIGVRKVLGASILGVIQLISKDFVKLVVIAILIGFPIAFWIMDDWLRDFAYRIAISWRIFVLAGAIALVIALLTVGLQSLKVALMNPVKSLRND